MSKRGMLHIAAETADMRDTMKLLWRTKTGFIKQNHSPSWDVRVSAVGLGFLSALVIFMITCLCGAALYVRAVRALKVEVRENLIRTAQIAAALIDGDGHQAFTDPKQEKTPAYLHALKPLSQLQNASEDIKYIYTCVLKQSKVYFVLDPTPAGTFTADGVENKSHIMQLYPEAGRAIILALRSGKAQADTEPTKDSWGMLLSGFAPIHDSQGRCVGIVGVDLTANRYVAHLASMHRAAQLGVITAAILSFLAGCIVFAGQKRLLQTEEGRRHTSAALQRACDELEMRVKARTEELAEANFSLNQAYEATIEGWSRALDLRDHETEGHSRRVTEMTLRLAREIGISEEELVPVRRGALLHDIGKMGVPDRVLLKPGPLTDDEWAVMRWHPTLACEMLEPITFLHAALDIPGGHHEKWDGTGYPDGLAGEDIPLAARLFAVVDVWDALRSDRPYRKAWPEERVLDHLCSLSGSHFDPQIVRVFMALVSGENGTSVLERDTSVKYLLAV